MPSPVWGLGACPQKKNQFCAKNYAILSKFWYFFAILQQKVVDYPPVLKVGTYIPLSPLLRHLWINCYSEQVMRESADELS